MITLAGLFNHGMSTTLAFLDLRKAFDTVDRSLLISKLLRILGSRHSLNWLKSYLSDRTQATKVNGIISEMKHIEYGVPQGSILGPFLM